MESQVPEPRPARSAFINAIAWFFVVFAGLATFMLVIQNVTLWSLFPAKELESAMEEAKAAGTLPPYAEFVFKHLPAIFLFLLVASAVTCISAIGLLMRRDWARIVFIGLMIAGIASNVGGLALQFVLVSSINQASNGVPAEVGAQVNSFAALTMVTSGVTAIAFSALFAWIIKLLRSARIRQEFS